MKSVLTPVDYQVINNLIAQKQQVGMSQFTRVIQSLSNDFMCEWDGNTFYIYKNGLREEGIHFVVDENGNLIKNVKLEHKHDEYASVNHTHDEYASVNHTHDEYLTELPEHTHEEYASTSHTHEEYASTSHTHDKYLSAPIISDLKAVESQYVTATNLEATNASISGNLTVNGSITANNIPEIKYYDDNDKYFYKDYFKYSVTGSFSDGKYTYTIEPAITADNLKFGTQILLARVEIVSSSSSLITAQEDLRYSKTPNSDGSYTITWHFGSVTYDLYKTVFTVCSGYSGYTVKRSQHSFDTCLMVYRTGEYLQECALKNAIVNAIYPIGSIYTTLSKLDPATLLGVGKWVLVRDRFLRSITGNIAGTVGGSAKISVGCLPAHNHGILSQYNDFSYDHGDGRTLQNSTMSIPWDGGVDGTKNRTTYTNNTGSGTDYWQPYFNVYHWYRVA